MTPGEGSTPVGSSPAEPSSYKRAEKTRRAVRGTGAETGGKKEPMIRSETQAVRSFLEQVRLRMTELSDGASEPHGSDVSCKQNYLQYGYYKRNGDVARLHYVVYARYNEIQVGVQARESSRILRELADWWDTLNHFEPYPLRKEGQFGKQLDCATIRGMGEDTAEQLFLLMARTGRKFHELCLAQGYKPVEEMYIPPLPDDELEYFASSQARELVGTS
jgi:hypothetical protein